AADRRDERKRTPDVAGRVAAISADGKTLTLEAGGRGEEPKKPEIKLTDKTRIEFSGILKDAIKTLKVGDQAAVSFAEGSRDTAASIQVQRPADLTGKITAVSADEKLLTLEVPGKGRNTPPLRVEIKLTDKTRIEAGGRGGEDRKLQVDHTAS